MKSIKQNIPNAITSLNLLFGCIAIVLVFENKVAEASWMIVFAAVADFFDGMTARLLKVHSPIGKELDSLADVVSFGVAPGMIIYQLIGTHPYNWAGLIVPVFAALRLAKFNIDDRQTTHFIGLPSPANALFITSFPLILQHDTYWQAIYRTNIIFSTWFLIGIAILCSALMVSPINLFSLKMKDTSWTNNKTRYIFVILSVVCLAVLRYTGVPVIMALYVLFSLVSKKSFEEPPVV
jgi:CDP-diacylglycerol--serine O-phosphatidyltransferase